MWNEATHLYTYVSNRVLYRRQVKALAYVENPTKFLVEFMDGSTEWADSAYLQKINKYKE